MRSHARTIVVLALAVGLVALFFRNVDLGQVVAGILRARPEWLADISRWSGGRVFAAKRSEPLVIEAALGGATPATIEYRRQPLWDTWVWLSAIVGLLTLEWVARRVRGLA